MLRGIIVILWLYVAVNCHSQSEYQIAAIAFYNMENLHDTIDDPIKNDQDFLPNGLNRYTGEVYWDKLGKLAEVVSKLGVEKTPDGPAIIGLAEIENISVLEDLVKQPAIASRNYKPILVEGPDIRGVDVAMIYNPKYFTPVKVNSIFVPLINEKGDTSFTRDILWVKGLLMSEMIHVFVNHWPSRRGGEVASAPRRNKAAGICREVIDSIFESNPESKIIVMGDLNDDPINESVRKHLNAGVEVYDKYNGSNGRKPKKKCPPDQLYNPFLPYYKQGVGTLAWNNAWNLFDQIILSEPWLSKEQEGFFFHQAEVFNRSFLMQTTGNFKGHPFRSYVGSVYMGGYSDHFPVLIYLLKKLDSK